MEFKKRDSLADLGMVVAISVFIVILIKSLLFGVSWGAIVWFIISIAYIACSFFIPSDDRKMKYATCTFLALSVCVAGLSFLFDQNARPKMHAFEGALSDTTEEEAFVVRDDPEILVVQTIDTIHVDTADIIGDLDLNIDLGDDEIDTKIEDVEIIAPDSESDF